MAFPALIGSAVLASWLDPAPDADDEFNNWYNWEHLPERIGLPGFLRGRRFVAADPSTNSGGKYFTLYEATSLQALESPEYLARLNSPTPWTVTVIDKVTQGRRMACGVTASRGQGTAGTVLTAELHPRRPEARDWLVNHVFTALLRERHAMSVHLFEHDKDVTNARSTTAEGERGDSRMVDDNPSLLMLAELSDATHADPARSILLEAITRHGNPAELSRADPYQLLVEMVSPDTFSYSPLTPAAVDRDTAGVGGEASP